MTNGHKHLGQVALQFMYHKPLGHMVTLHFDMSCGLMENLPKYNVHKVDPIQKGYKNSPK